MYFILFTGERFKVGLRKAKMEWIPGNHKSKLKKSGQSSMLSTGRGL